LTLQIQNGRFDPNRQIAVPNVIRMEQMHERSISGSRDYDMHRDKETGSTVDGGGFEQKGRIVDEENPARRHGDLQGALDSLGRIDFCRNTKLAVTNCPANARESGLKGVIHHPCHSGFPALCSNLFF
jgi:hypothetical protein